MTSPTTGGKRVVVALGNKVVCLELESGKRAWEVTAQTPAVLRVFVEAPWVYVLGAKLARLHLETGAVDWLADVTTGRETLLVHDGFVLAGGAGEAGCYDAQTGRRLWHEKFPGYGLGPVALAVPGAVAQADVTT